MTVSFNFKMAVYCRQTTLKAENITRQRWEVKTAAQSCAVVVPGSS